MPDIITKEIQAVVFSLGEEEYGIDIGKVQEIIRLPEVTRLPGTTDYVMGIINLRGSIIPIVDLKKMSMQIDSDFTDETRVIVLEIGAKKVGLIVDEVAEVINIPTELVVASQDIGTRIQAEYLLGIARLGQRLLILLNVERILG